MTSEITQTVLSEIIAALSSEEAAILPQIEHIKLPSGFYQTSKLVTPNGDTIADFWGNSDEDQESFDMSDPRVALAEKINTALDAALAEHERVASAAEAAAIIKKIENKTATRRDWLRLVSMGKARETGLDFEGMPMYTLDWPVGDPYADQAGVEEGEQFA